MQNFPEAIVLPPKVFFYEPRIFGFKVCGKLGSAFYKPALSGVEDAEEREDVEKLVARFKETMKGVQAEEEKK